MGLPGCLFVCHLILLLMCFLFNCGHGGRTVEMVAGGRTVDMVARGRTVDMVARGRTVDMVARGRTVDMDVELWPGGWR